MAQDEQSIRRFLSGDVDAFEAIVRGWEGKVYNLALRYLGNREDAQDVAQETFLTVYTRLQNLRDVRSFRTWLYRITLNYCRAHWRSRPNESSLDEPLSSTAPSHESDKSVSLGELLSMRHPDEVEIRDLISKSLAGLNDDHRTAIVLKEYLGLSLEEVAQVMDCPLSTAKSRLYHGLRGVQRNLKRLL